MDIRTEAQTDNTREAMEAKLAEKAAGGSKEAFCELYGLYKDKLYRYALYRLSDPSLAEDAVSDCILAAWKDIGKLRSGSAFGAWIFRILHNICASHVRKAILARQSLEQLGQEQTVSRGTDPLTGIEISEALAQLSDEEREVVLLSVVSGLTSREISEITGLTPGSTRSRLSRSLAKMRAYLN